MYMQNIEYVYICLKLIKSGLFIVAVIKKGTVWQCLVYHQLQHEPQLGSIMPRPYRLVNGAK
jgi:hypothetical protein